MCTQEIEDETHFFTNCKLYGTRDAYWTTIYEKVPQISILDNVNKFIYLMTQEDPEVTNLILKMNYEWMSLRKFLNETFYNQK